MEMSCRVILLYDISVASWMGGWVGMRIFVRKSKQCPSYLPCNKLKAICLCSHNII